MIKDARETEGVAPRDEIHFIPPRRKIFDRFHRYGGTLRNFFPSLDRREILGIARQQDEEKNAKTEPPADELIDLRCIWAIEFYTRSQTPQLFGALEKLGWTTTDTDSQHCPKRWIQRVRETAHGGGCFNLGPIHRPGDQRFFDSGRAAPLPSEADYALAAMYSLTSSITCIVIGFVLDEQYTGRLNESLRCKRQTTLEPLPDGTDRPLDPCDQKTADIRTIRGELRESAANWFRSYLPGIFASGILRGEFPTCEFVTLRTARPFPKEVERDHEAEQWLRLLDLDNDTDAWEADGLPGLKFAWPRLRDGKSRFHALVAAKEDAFSVEELQPYGGYGRPSYDVLYVDRRVNGILSRWALLGMLIGFERHLNKIREAATSRSTQRRNPLHWLAELSGHISQSVDIATASAELRHFTQQAESFEHELDAFKPSNPALYSDEEITLSRVMRTQAEERSAWLENIDRSVKEFLPQAGTILSAREDIELQSRMGRLSLLMVSLTIGIAAFIALSTYIAIRMGLVA